MGKCVLSRMFCSAVRAGRLIPEALAERERYTGELFENYI